MKNIIKFICSFICYLLFIPCILGLTVCATWYLLPSFQSTQAGLFLVEILEEQAMFTVTMGLGMITIFLFLMGKLFTVIKNSKALNLYTHLITWLVALALSAESVYAFLMSGVIESTTIDLNMFRKIGVMICAVILLVYSMIAPKVRTIVNRRIQAYDTAKELNAEGRSSIVGMQILKCLDFICPELFLLIALCFAFDWTISLYFVFIICSFIIPIIGNMICDRRVRKEAKKRKDMERDALVSEIVNAVK